MPELFHAAMGSARWPWNFSSWAPRILFINLGTNDHLQPEYNETEKLFVKVYTSMVEDAAAKYAPANGYDVLHVVLAIGPDKVNAAKYLPKIARRLRRHQHIKTYQFTFNELPWKDQCCGHPDVTADLEMSRNATKFIQDVVLRGT